MEDSITRAEHAEFARRMGEENDRQNRRLELLEESAKRLESLNISIEKLAANMEGMLKEQMRQGNRLEQLEARDGELWRKAVGYAATAVLGVLIGFVFRQLGM